VPTAEQVPADTDRRAQANTDEPRVFRILQRVPEQLAERRPGSHIHLLRGTIVVPSAQPPQVDHDAGSMRGPGELVAAGPGVDLEAIITRAGHNALHVPGVCEKHEERGVTCERLCTNQKSPALIDCPLTAAPVAVRHS
jgi:hypothetical protein